VASVEDAVAFAKAAPQPDPETLYEGLYSPEFMRQQGMTR
jgi:TPP-dependent pyruvate/acetoin dehydrogenase alpha subunit